MFFLRPQCFSLWLVLYSILSTQVLTFSLCIWRWHSPVQAKSDKCMNEYFYMVMCHKAIDKKVSNWERVTLDKAVS